MALRDPLQHLRDIKLALEFKYLMKFAPSGIYLMPEFDNIRNLHGNNKKYFYRISVKNTNKAIKIQMNIKMKIYINQRCYIFEERPLSGRGFQIYNELTTYLQ